MKLIDKILLSLLIIGLLVIIYSLTKIFGVPGEKKEFWRHENEILKQQNEF